MLASAQTSGSVGKPLASGRILSERDARHGIERGRSCSLPAMTMNSQNAMYSRTQNDDGTYNSRCLDCLLTIAFSVETEEALAEREARHMCPEKALAWLFTQREADAGQPSQD
jgi:hypothetical protein